MQKIALLSLLLCLGNTAFSHSEHAQPGQIELVERSSENKPVMMNSTSVKLLESAIGLTGGDHGQGRFFKIEDTQVKRLVNQGFTMLNMFQWVDAFRSFNEALVLDPKSVEAHIGRGFASISLNGQESYYLIIARDFLVKNISALTVHQKSWGDLLLAMVTRAGVDEQQLSVAQAYTNLKINDPENMEVFVFANWVSKTYDLNAFMSALDADPSNAGATHYILHLGEMRGDHDTAIKYGEMLSRFAPGSGHGQHMYGHALPHFNRWHEADRQFTIAHELHKTWALRNGVPRTEDWHYIHNLDLWSVTNMVLNPARAILILEELSSFSDSYIPDLLDLQVASGTNLALSGDKIAKYESVSSKLKEEVSSSRMLHTLLSNVAEFDKIGHLLITDQKDVNSYKTRTLFYAIKLIETSKSGDTDLHNQIIDAITKELSNDFRSGGFDGWRRSVLETLVYTRIFEAYGLNQAEKELRSKVIDVHMNPVD